ncbi:MAG: hypothetical protein GYA17_12975 [Chloroflexi bacterium]|jgi:hypothetical protein|nr:NBR1-Ig-like domain-containing protein [Anaerolineaceae bacterium]NMB89266.1 hypothetical protein [Chloroflexota bacterium]
MKKKLITIIFILAMMTSVAASPMPALSSDASPRPLAGGQASVVVLAPEEGQTVRPNTNDLDAVIEVTNETSDPWDPGYYIRRETGTSSISAGQVTINDAPLGPGETAVVRFDLTAPGTAGYYREIWVVVRPDGYIMERFQFSFNVSGDALAVNDTSAWSRINVLYPDAGYYLLSPNQSDVDILISIENSSPMDWTTGYYIAQESGTDITPAFNTQNLPVALAVGDKTTIRLEVQAPSSTGDYGNTWVLYNTSGQIIGRFWFTIYVRGDAWANPTTTSYAQITVLGPTVQKPAIVNDTGVDAVVDFKNTGQTTWTPSYTIGYESGSLLTKKGYNLFALNGNVAPGETLRVYFDLKAPNTTGDYGSTWVFKDPAGNVIGRFWYTLRVVYP